MSSVPASNVTPAAAAAGPGVGPVGSRDGSVGSGAGSVAGRNRVLDKMLDRLFAALVNGPSLNARPHNSRQRVDFSHLSRLGDAPPDKALAKLLGAAREVKLSARVPMPKRRSFANRRGRFGRNGRGANGNGSHAPGHKDAPAENDRDDGLTDAEREAERRWLDQQGLLGKLRVIADDARTYEQDTGVHVLNVGFPMLSLPPGAVEGRGGTTRRVLAPVAFIPVSITLGGGAAQSVRIACRADGMDLVSPNNALLAWLEQQTGKKAVELFGDEAGEDPWREVCELVAHVCETLEIAVPDLFQLPKEEAKAPQAAGEERPQDVPTEEPIRDLDPAEIEEEVAASQAPKPPAGPAVPPPKGMAALKLQPAPRADESDAEQPAILPCAILGLFPMANQGLLRDMQAMAAGEALGGPVKSFVDVSAGFFDKLPEEPSPQDAAARQEQAAPRAPRAFTDEKLVTHADPFQSRAVKLARQSRGLVIHGPPGTGKSQTITNIIGDHLSRGQRVLLVCDKRTALDVVDDRLEHMGLGRLCALIHDPQRDQRELYRAVREQLDALPDTTTDERAEAKLAKADAELQKLHGELSAYGDALMRSPDGRSPSLHDLVGQWVDLSPVDLVVDRSRSTPASQHPNPLPGGEGAKAAAIVVVEEAVAQSIPLAELDDHGDAVRDILQRAEAVGFAENPWARSVGPKLADYVSRPMEQVRSGMEGCVAAARDADATADPDIPPFPPEVDILPLGRARGDLADRVERVVNGTDRAVLNRWAGAATRPAGGNEAVHRARKSIDDAATFLQAVSAGPLDAELALAVKAGALPEPTAIAQQLASLAQYLEVARKWWSFLAFGRKRQAAEVLNRYGLTLSPAAAERVHGFLTALRARLALRDLLATLDGQAGAKGELPDDATLTTQIGHHAAALDLLVSVSDDPALRDVLGPVTRAMADPTYLASLLDGLRRSPARAANLAKLERALADARLFDAAWLAAVSKKLRAGQMAANYFASLAARLDTLEGVLRVREGTAALPAPLRPAAESLVKQSAPPEEGMNVLRRQVLAGEISRRLRESPNLQAYDGQRLRQMFDRYRELDGQKKALVRDAVLHKWTTVQKDRLLAATGSRLNSLGADLKRRLTSRGERAMRLRQVVAVGRQIEGGDPLFDLRPIWMASPETVAQVFPREPIFDVVIFDEASQCRLEEALPVLVRGGRVTIAGDPKQLPPTRFFESAVAASDDDGEIESDQQLFEMQQGETEDLLTAALGLDIQQCYLDVHYRSRSAELIAFSNEHFYGSRLQPIPGHPSNRPALPPVAMVRADGVYDKRENEPEADKVVQIVRDLLGRKDPPSIGIACFNLSQRDLIVEKLDEGAAEDERFARRLNEARNRKGAGSFEGLFVKNLENVQGDERDHIIISTTYGPDTRGKFYRRFGPLGRAGGGRRLNVLVTRAREQVHLVTSIPPEAYRSLPEVPPGQAPGGPWLLFAYLKYAEELTRSFATAEGGVVAPAAPQPEPRVEVRPTSHGSAFAQALARKLVQAHGVGSDVHWGNEGFCVDMALYLPQRPEHPTAGVLCDVTRFAAAGDATEWDAFRTAVLERQGWRLHRVWSPHFFRDPKGTVRAILQEMERHAPKDAATTSRTAASPSGRHG